MRKNIYNVQVLMESQKQCDRMKQICIKYSLHYWRNIMVWEFIDKDDTFRYGESGFYIHGEPNKFEKVTETEFVKLLKNE